MRNKINVGRFGAKPHSADASVNPMVEASSSRLRPNCRASQPAIGRIIAFATRYEVSTHVASSTVAETLPAMCGSDTFTTVVSSTSMNVLSMTDMATIHGFTCG